MVFCALHEDKETFLKDVHVLTSKLGATPPFSAFPHDIALYHIVLLPEEAARIFKEAPGIPPLQVRRDFLQTIAVRLKGPYKLVIIDASGGTSTAELSDPHTTSLIILGKGRYTTADSFAKGFLHELGHSLGLRDEGVSGTAGLAPPGPPNCAATEEEAKAWWGDLEGNVARVGYIHGCGGNKNYIRPTIASFMNDPDKAGDYGPVNTRYLSRIFQ